MRTYRLALWTFEYNVLCQVVHACELKQMHSEKQSILEQFHQTDVWEIQHKGQPGAIQHLYD